MNIPFINQGETETERELREFCEQRKYERDVFESALKNWLLGSGLGDIMMDQTEGFARQAGLDGWPDHLNMYRDVEFDARRSDHRDITERLIQIHEEQDIPPVVYIVTYSEGEAGRKVVEAFRTRKEAEERAGRHSELYVEEVGVPSKSSESK